MDTTIFLAKIFGCFYVVVGLGMLFDKKYLKSVFDDMMKSPGMLYLGGIMAFGLGLVLVMYHNIWEGGWLTILVTLFGWAALLKGIMYLVFPKVMSKIAKSVVGIVTCWCTPVIILVFGVVFLYGAMM